MAAVCGWTQWWAASSPELTFHLSKSLLGKSLVWKKSVFYLESPTTSFQPLWCRNTLLWPLEKGAWRWWCSPPRIYLSSVQSSLTPIFQVTVFSLHFVHHTKRGNFWATSVMCIPCRILEGLHLPKFSAFFAFKKICLLLFIEIQLYVCKAWFWNILSCAIVLWSLKSCVRLSMEI